MTMMDEVLFKSVGGRPVIMNGGDVVWNFGYRAARFRTDSEEAERTKVIALMPRFRIIGKSMSEDHTVKAALLYELWKHPNVVAANGRPYTGIKQLTGSCVGCGAGNALFTLAAYESIRLGQSELALIPFWPLPYGRSRFYLGDRNPGEGSTGSTMAKAVREDGVLPAIHPGLPQPTDNDGMACWGARVEMAWSDGDSKQTLDLLPLSRKHLVQTTAQCADANDVREAIMNGYPCTAASMYAHDGGKVTSDPPILVARKSGSWAHQMSVQGFVEHPKLGELFYLMNQWGATSHGQDPFGAPPGGVWITAADMSWICRDEVFAFSQFQGFPSPSPTLIPWIF